MSADTVTPECFAEACAQCDSDACACECHFDGAHECLDPNVCEYCGDWTPCECDIQIMRDLDLEGEAEDEFYV